jgi:predicted lipoprotein with Yx(FWY)xxD motif
MHRSHQPGPGIGRSRRLALGAAGVAAILAGVAAIALAGLAAARSFTLKIAKNAAVGSAHEAIVVNARGFAVYTLSHETTHHVLCTQANGCLSFWPPVTVASAKAKLSAQPGIKGKLGILRRGGFFQLTLGGHPLYTFIEDARKGQATGNGVHGFRVVVASSARSPVKQATTPAPMPYSTTTAPTASTPAPTTTATSASTPAPTTTTTTTATTSTTSTTTTTTTPYGW